MQRLHRALRVLLRGALIEHGLNAPALVDITIEPAAEPRIWAEFANGYRTSVPLRPEFSSMDHCTTSAVDTT